MSLWEMRNLVSLNLRGNNIASVGDEISKLPSTLKVRSFILSVGNLCAETGMQELSLGKNKIASIPNSVSMLTSLVHLDLSENALKAIPIVATALTGLTTLDLQHNLLGPALPNAVCGFSALTVLRLHDNKYEHHFIYHH